MKLGIIFIFMLVSICHGLKLSIDPPCNDDLFAINPNQVKPVSNNQKYPSGAAANNQNVNASVQSNIVTQGTINGQQQPTSNFNNNRNNNPNMNPNNSNNTSNSNPINNSNSNSNSSDQ